MSNDYEQSLFAKNKSALEEMFFESLTNRKGIDGKTCFEKDTSKYYLRSHPNFGFEKSKNVLVPIPSNILNPKTIEERTKLAEAKQKIHNYMNENKIETYILYSTLPIYEKRVKTPFEYGNFYAFVTEYKAYSQKDELIACNLYCCTSCPNKVANKDENDEITYILDENDRHLFWNSRKEGYDVLRGLSDKDSVPELSKEDVYNWLTQRQFPKFNRYMMVNNILTDDRIIIDSIDKLDIANGEFYKIKNHQNGYEFE